jgi:hypothetical protein
MVHLGQAPADASLDVERWQDRWSACSWRAYLAAGETQSELAAIRHCTYTGRPLGTEEFVKQLEKNTRRRLAAQNGGRTTTRRKESRQSKFAFAG